MAWIKTLREDRWTGDLASLYETVIDREHGRVDNIMQIHSLNPHSMKPHQGLYMSAMAGTKSLRKVERELVALIVSTANRCDY